MIKNLTKKILSVLLALVLVAGTTGLGTLSASAVTDPVHNVTQNTYYGTIQSAVDAAVEGDVIEVAPGNYFESVTVDVNGLTIRSTGGRDVTGVSGGTAGFQVEVKEFVLDGFSLMPSEWGVNVLAVSGGDITIQNCLFANSMYSVLFGNITDTEVNLLGNIAIDSTWRGFIFGGVVTESDIVVSGNSMTELNAEGGVNFSSDLDRCTVDISNNTIINSPMGVYVDEDIKETLFGITGNTFTGGDDGVYFSYSDYGVYDDSVLTIEDNTFYGQSGTGIYIDYLEQNGSAVVSGNTITGAGSEAICVDYVGYYYPDAPASITISDNTIVDCSTGVDFYDICYGSVLVQDNVIKNAYYGVYIDYSADESVTDVQILDNTITLDENTESCYAGVYVYSAEKSLKISGNTITGYSEYLDYGVYLEYIGYYGAETSEIEIADNTISKCEAGIYLYDVADELDAEVMISGNEVKDTDYGIYIENMDSYAATVDVVGNLVHGNGYGVYLADMYGEDDYETILTLKGNVIKYNETGINLEYVYLEQSIPGIMMMDNAIVENGTGITLEYIYAVSDDLILINGNNISGNETYGIELFAQKVETAPAMSPQQASVNPDFVLQAQWNWWGDATGPEYMGNGADGDEVTGNVDFDPWIKELVIDPKDSSGFKENARTFTATLLDSNGDPVDLPLTILFAITGANDLKGSSVLSGGVATFSYTSDKEGTDKVVGGVAFAGAYDEELASDVSAVWLASAEGNPDTGDGGLMWLAMLASLMALAGAVGTVLYRKKATIKTTMK